jgi:hypothetical protein
MKNLETRILGRNAKPTNDALSSAALIHLADALTVPDGGFSVAVESWKDIRTGYAVSVFPEHEYCASSLVSHEDIERYVSDHAALLARPHVVLGGWRSPEDGFAYLDVSVVVPTRDAALTFAREYGQKAIWDFAGCESIPIIGNLSLAVDKARTEAAERQPGSRG